MSSDIAAQLLHSTDARIAEAAKRVFSSHPSSSYGAIGGSKQRPSAPADGRVSAIDGLTREVTTASIDNNNNGKKDEVSSESLMEDDRKLSSSERLKRR